MPADDLVLNVRQIAQYPPVSSAPAPASLLMQLAGIGSAYASISPQALVSTALAQGGSMAIAGQLGAASVQAGSGQFSNLAVNLLSAQKACVVEFDATWGSIGGVPIATQAYADALHAASVQSFNGRSGAVCLWIQDILNAGGAPLWSPVFGGEPRAPTPAPNSCNSRLATTAFVQRLFIDGFNNVLATHPFVFTFNGRSGDIVLTADDIIAAGGSGEIFDSPAFTGIPTAPTAPPGTNTTQIATTAFVMQSLTGLPYAPINSPVFTGVPQGPTAPPGSTTGQLATTAFVMNAVAASVTGVASFNTRTGNVVLEASDVTGVGGALLASPAFTGNPTAPTAAPGDNDTSIATTAFVTSAVNAIGGGVTSFNTRTGAITLSATDLTGAGGALLASPNFSGTPQAPTAAFGNSSQQIATTAFVAAAILNGAVESFNGRVGNVTLTSADISAAGGAALNSPAFTGTPTAPTAAPGANSTQLATTAFVTAAIGVGAGVTSWNGRTGAVVLTLLDVTNVGGAQLNSPALTGVPTAPTASFGASSTQLATTAFVQAALAGGAGVSSFNTRTGAITLLGADITSAGGALLSSPTFTGTPAAPTQTAGNSSTALATTAFVQAAIVAGSVSSFNGRVGAITLNSADISAAGGALLASPNLTGSPTSTTPTIGDNSNRIATTQFVDTALAAAGGVNSFNGRAGAVTLTGADLTGAGGALSTDLAAYMPLAGGTFTGTVNHGTNTAIAPIRLNGPAASSRAFQAFTANVQRWSMSLGTAEAETGSNAGSNFAISSFNDAGGIITTPLTITRSSGLVTASGTLAANAGSFATTVNAGGNVTAGQSLVGATSVIPSNSIDPNFIIYANGSVSRVIQFTTGSYLHFLNIGTGAQVLQTGGGQMTIANNGDCTLNVGTAYKPGGGAWLATSDERVKENVQPYKAGLEAVLKLMPVSFRYNGLGQTPKNGKTYHGLSAQKTREVMPELVVEMDIPKGIGPLGRAVPREPDILPGELAVDSGPLVYALVNCVKELAARLTALEARTA